MTTTTTDIPDAVFAGIASGTFVTYRTAAEILRTGYFTIRRRLIREGVETWRIGGRCYVPATALANPRLRVP